jgi:hypothetical protein
VREEDVNVDLGNQFAPTDPAAPCNGDDHVIDQSTLTPRSTTYFGVAGAHAPLCDKQPCRAEERPERQRRLLHDDNFRTDPNGTAPDTRTVMSPSPGRSWARSSTTSTSTRNQMSRRGTATPRPIGNIPIGIYARVDVRQSDGSYSITGKEIGRDGTGAPDCDLQRRHVAPDHDGAHERGRHLRSPAAPRPRTLNCPIPQGPCPGMYIAIVDDPGTKLGSNSRVRPTTTQARPQRQLQPQPADGQQPVRDVGPA